jgi:adenylyltransferase/sulfurtransferase
MLSEFECESEYTKLKRYSRQMLVSQFGTDGQNIISNSSVAVIGAGGIGSTVLLYLAGAGIGSITIVDYDDVEITNLHRQVIHDNDSCGMKKAVSAKDRIMKLNPEVVCHNELTQLTSSNALDILKPHDIVVDATDNFKSRYLISDACVMLKKPLISAAAVGLEGQISVLCVDNGPCYRCLYPSISQSEECRSCDNAGVIGPVPGLMGCLQCIEALKVLIHIKRNYASKSTFTALKPLINRQLIYDGCSGEFMTFKLPGKDSCCIVCGNDRKIMTMEDSNEWIRSSMNKVKCQHPILPTINTITVTDYYNQFVKNCLYHILLDVRNTTQYEMISFKYYDRVSVNRSINLNEQERFSVDMNYICLQNIPLLQLQRDQTILSNIFNRFDISHQLLQSQYNNNHLDTSIVGANEDSVIKKRKIDEISMLSSTTDEHRTINKPIFILCRRGIDSIKATELLLKNGYKNVININGGLQSWKEQVDPNFPSY